MKRWILLAAVLLVFGASSLYAQNAVLQYNYYKTPADFTCSTQVSGTWTTIDSLVSLVTDTGFTIIEVNGVAVMNPKGRLYIGLGSNKDLTTLLDTLLVQTSEQYSGVQRVPFYMRYVTDSTATQTDLTDTTYLQMACGGSGAFEFVKIEDLVWTIRVVNGPH